MGLADFRRTRGVTQDELAVELKLGHKGSVSAIETGREDAGAETAMRVQVWSGGAVQAAELRPDLAELFRAFAGTTRTKPAEAPPLMAV